MAEIIYLGDMQWLQFFESLLHARFSSKPMLHI